MYTIRRVCCGPRLAPFGALFAANWESIASVTLLFLWGLELLCSLNRRYESAMELQQSKLRKQKPPYALLSVRYRVTRASSFNRAQKRGEGSTPPYRSLGVTVGFRVLRKGSLLRPCKLCGGSAASRASDHLFLLRR